MFIFDLKYYLPEKPGDSIVIKTFKFKTKSKSADFVNPPFFGISAGYILDTNFIPKSSTDYKIN